MMNGPHQMEGLPISAEEIRSMNDIDAINLAVGKLALWRDGQEEMPSGHELCRRVIGAMRKRRFFSHSPESPYEVAEVNSCGSIAFSPLTDPEKISDEEWVTYRDEESMAVAYCKAALIALV